MEERKPTADVEMGWRQGLIEKQLCKSLPISIFIVISILVFFGFLPTLWDLWDSYEFVESRSYHDLISKSNNSYSNCANHSSIPSGNDATKTESASPVVAAQLAPANDSAVILKPTFWCGARPCEERISCSVSVNAAYPFQEPTLTWSPRPNRYLMMICGYREISNRINCVLQHLVVAAFLNRTLVFPLHEMGYDFENLVDIPRISQCLGENTVVSLAEFRKSRNGNDHVDVMRALNNEHPGAEDGIMNFKMLTKIKIETSTKASHFGNHNESSAKFFRQFDMEAEVLSVGEAFGTNIGPEACLQLRGFQPFKTTCTGPVLQPHDNILRSAFGFARMFLGFNYTSLHLRRGDFFSYCNWKGNQCYYSIPQVADCLRRHQREIDGCEGSNLIYVATNGRHAELEQLQAELLSDRDRCPLTIVTLSGVLGELGPEGIPLQEWSSPLNDEQRKNGDVLSALDRAISALGRVFLGDSFSTFTAEILRLRVGWRINHDRDGFLCVAEGIKPDLRDFIWQHASDHRTNTIHG